MAVLRLASLGSSLLAVALALGGCSSDSGPPAASAGSSVPTPRPEPKPADADCSTSPAPRPPGSTCVGIVHGQLLDGGDAPVSAPIAVCGGGVICVGAAVDEGVFSVPVNRFVDLSTFVLHVYGHPHHGDMIARLPAATTSNVTLNGLPRVPRYEFKGAELPAMTAAGSVVSSGPVELTLAPGTMTGVAPAHENTRELLAGAVPEPTRWDPDVIALYAVGPFSARFSSKAAVAITLPATPAIAEGTTLELVVLEDSLTEGKGGMLSPIGAATVKDGVARSVAGVGVSHLTWVGVRRPAGG